MHALTGSLGCGSAIAELAFAHAEIPLRVEDIPYVQDGPARTRLLAMNPLGQVPVLLTPDGDVLTESAAIVLHAHDLAPAAGLIPAGPAHRARAQNLLIVLAAAIYPTFTYGDFPERYVTPDAAAMLTRTTGQRREALWRQIDASLAPAPFAFGAQPCAVDFYIAVMRHFEPGPAWFARETPRIAAVADAVNRIPALAAVLARHFPPAPVPG